MVPVEGQPRERLEARWQIMMFAAGRVAPALRGRQSCRTNDRSRPTARRTSSGRARGSRASNKPCPRASLLHRVPNERNRVDARALGREWFLEKWPSGKFCWRVHREVILKVRRTIFSHDVTMYASASHSSFLTWIKVVFRDGRRLAHLLGQCRTTPATWSTPHWGACSVPRNHPTPAPDSPARQQAAEVKMVGYITISSRHSTAAQREVASLCLYICCHHFLYISTCSGDIDARHLPISASSINRKQSKTFCVGVGCEAGKLCKLADTVPKGVQAPAVAQLAETHKHMTSPWRHWSALGQGLFLSCVVMGLPSPGRRPPSRGEGARQRGGELCLSLS